MQKEGLEIVIDITKRRIERGTISGAIISIVENAIENSEGKTQERYELLKLWQQMTKTKEQK